MLLLHYGMLMQISNAKMLSAVWCEGGLEGYRLDQAMMVKVCVCVLGMRKGVK